MKTLVVYYSRTGTTKTIGESIANEINADSDEIIDLKARLGHINYMRAARDAKGLKTTTIKTEKDPSEYDLIVIGTPIWWGHLPPAILTYLQHYSLSGKKIAIFITSQGEDREAVFQQLTDLTTDCEIVGKLGILQKIVKAGAYRDDVLSFSTKIN